jgi:endoglucanase
MSLFWSQWKGQYYTKEVVDWLVEDWKCAVVRAALGVEMGGYLQNPEREFEKVITVVDAAIAKGIYVIVDWHDHHGEQHLPESKAFFAQIAQRYGKHPNIIYELYNEPLNVSWSVVLKPYHQAIIDTIRYYDQRNLIVCGTPNWSQDVDQVIQDPINDKNVSYALHFYATTHREGLRKKAKAALDKGLSIFVTEFGTTESTGNGLVDTNETALWMQFMDDYKLSWCNWSIADKNETSAALVGGASTTGGWTSDVITPSGKLVREYIRQSNP